MNHPNTSKSSPTLQYRYVEMTSDMTSSVILDRILSYFFQRRYAITFQMTSRLHSGRAASCPEIPENPEMSQMSWNCPEISNCPEILYIWSECPDMDLNLQIWCHQVASFKAKIHQIRFRLGLCPDPAGGAYNAPPCYPLDGFELSNINWTCLYMLIEVPVCFSSYNNNIYEDRKTCIFCVLSLVKPTKMSWNCPEIF